MAHARTDETLLTACVEAIDHHAQLLATVLRSSLWTLAAQEHGAKALRAVRNEDWSAAQDALDEALSLILGGYGPRSLPKDTAAWAFVCEGVIHGDAESWPDTLTHDGRAWRRTRKVGNNVARGVPAAEYEADDAARVWRLTTGEVVPE